MDVTTILISDSNIFAGGDTGGLGQVIFLSTNNGASWEDVSNGLIGSTVMSLAISGDTIFAGVAGGGVWKRPLTEMVGINNIKIESSELHIYPNPVNSLLAISCQLSEKSSITLKVYDITGREIGTLADGIKNKGEFERLIIILRI